MNPVVFTDGMEIDADGSPYAYTPAGSNLPALDYLANAGHPGNWYGIVTDNGMPSGNPVVQGAGDPYPGGYVSVTALQDHTKKASDPARYVNSSAVPYVVVPPEILHHGIHLGDLAWVSYRDKSCGAIVADVGPHGKYGEGSVMLAVMLGIISSPKHGGCGGGVNYVIFPGTSKGWPRSVNDIQSEAKELYRATYLPQGGE